MATIRDGEKIRDTRSFDKLYEAYRRFLRAERLPGERDYEQGLFQGHLDHHVGVTGEAYSEVMPRLQERAERHSRMATLDAAWKGGGADRGEG